MINPDSQVLFNTNNLLVLSPMIILGLTALVILLVEILPIKKLKLVNFLALVGVFLSIITLLIGKESFGVSISLGQNLAGFDKDISPTSIIYQSLYADSLVWSFSLLILITLLTSLLIRASSSDFEGVDSPAEYCSLLLLSAIGALLMLGGSNMLVTFVGLELMSLPLYALVASVPQSKSSSEGGLKYFLLGSFSSAVMLYGIALIYGITGSLDFTAVASSPQLVGMGGGVALALFLSGFIFKLGAFPLHFWMPDAYQGAPISTMTFMSTGIKVAVVGVLGRILSELGNLNDLGWEGLIWSIAVLSMVAGNVAALRQTSFIRMLSYSGIAHAGYLLVGFLTTNSIPVLFYYLITYCTLMILILAAFVSISRSQTGTVEIKSLKGMGRDRPFLGISISLALFSLAGLPPGLAGMYNKIFLLQEAVRTGYVGLSLIMLLCSVVGCFYYLRVALLVWQPSDFEIKEAGPALADRFSSNLVVLGAFILLILLSVFPQIMLSFVTSVAVL